MRKPLLIGCLLAVSVGASLPALAQGARSPQPPPAAAIAPSAAPIRTFYDVLLGAMKNGKALGVEGRFKKLEAVVDATFDLPAMTQLMVGLSWNSMSQADRDRLISSVRRMTIAGYAHNFDDYGGENFVVSPTIQERDGDQIVSTRMTAPGKEDVPFVYRMRNSRGTWKVVDIYLDGTISQVAFRRSDFSSTLRSGGAPALAEKIDALTKRMLAGGP
jgi:phospholipid transport system substrate-binding protein